MTTHPPPTPCFLVGAPRSGTTWIQRLLQSHPAICGGEESHFFTLFARALQDADEMGQRDQRPIGPLTYVSRDGFDRGLRQLWAHIFEDLYKSAPNAAIHLEKTPFHTLCMAEITRLFPEAKFIFLTRDSRAVASSLVQAGRSWGSHWAPADYKSAALEWQRHVRAVLKWQKARPETPILTIRYEDALADTEAVLGTALKFLLPETAELAVTDTLARFAETRTDRTDPQGFARLRGSAGWRGDMPLHARFTTWRYTRKTMRELGYDIAPFR